MKKRKFCIALGLLAAFALWTIAIQWIDVQSISPRGSAVGFATLNGFVHNLTGTNMTLYVITDWLGLVPVAFGFGFAALGLAQWIKRKSILKGRGSRDPRSARHLRGCGGMGCEGEGSGGSLRQELRQVHGQRGGQSARRGRSGTLNSNIKAVLFGAPLFCLWGKKAAPRQGAA